MVSLLTEPRSALIKGEPPRYFIFVIVVVVVAVVVVAVVVVVNFMYCKVCRLL